VKVTTAPASGRAQSDDGLIARHGGRRARSTGWCASGVTWTAILQFAVVGAGPVVELSKGPVVSLASLPHVHILADHGPAGETPTVSDTLTCQW